MSDGSNVEAAGFDDGDDLFNDVLGASDEGFQEGASPPPAEAAAPVAPAASPAPVAAPAATAPAAVPPADNPAAPAAPASPDQSANRPPARMLSELREERGKRQALERELQALRAGKTPAQPVNLFDQPEEFVQSQVQNRIDPVLSRVEEITHTYSERYAVKEYGAETVQSAVSALEASCERGEPGSVERLKQFMASPDPYGEAVAWFRSYEPVLNPQGYQERLLSDPAFLERAVAAAQAQAAARPITPAPPAPSAGTGLPSVNRAGQHASMSAADLEANITDDDLYASLTQPRDARGRFSANS